MARHRRGRRRGTNGASGAVGVDEPKDAATVDPGAPEASAGPVTVASSPGDTAPRHPPPAEQPDPVEGEPTSAEALPDAGALAADPGSAPAAASGEGDRAPDRGAAPERAPEPGDHGPAPEEGAPDPTPSGAVGTGEDDGPPAASTPVERPGPWLSALVAVATGAVVAVLLLAAGHVIHL